MAEFQTHKNDITKTRLVDVGNQPDDFTLADGVKPQLCSF